MGNWIRRNPAIYNPFNEVVLGTGDLLLDPHNSADAVIQLNPLKRKGAHRSVISVLLDLLGVISPKVSCQSWFQEHPKNSLPLCVVGFD